MILGIDTGGTFTDFALLREEPGQAPVLRTHKVLSTPDAPERAILQGIAEMGLDTAMRAGQLRIIHGSTVATNAALEGKGARTAFITNRGFRDMLSIARQTRPALYSLESPPQKPPVPEELCLEISCRLDANGRVLEELTEAGMAALLAKLEALQPEAIAINLLYSWLDDSHEVMLENYLREHLNRPVSISRSSFVLPEYKEYERGIATWLNASLEPLVRDYLLRLAAGTRPSPLAVMQSSGGTIKAELAARRSVNLLLSGPAGGLAAAAHLSRSLNEPNLMTFDMGGTSTDAALIREHAIRLGNEGRIGRYPVAVPMVDMHTIGAGGGSIAYVDAGGLLRVGPRSAGASPGPACYGLGGSEATVSDANLWLGRLLPETFMGGKMSLDQAAAGKAIKALAEQLVLTPDETALGIIELANEHMARALRVISVEKGYDPARFRLCCFGGAGGLHICALADALGMSKALVPMHAGVLSALGMLLAPVERQLSHSCQRLLHELDPLQTEQLLNELQQRALREMREENENLDIKGIEMEVSADIRYQGQSFSLTLPWQGPAASGAAFHALHETRYGHRLSVPPELVNFRLAARIPAPPHEFARLTPRAAAKPFKHSKLHGIGEQVPVYHRRELCPGQQIQGPALISEDNATTLISTGWLCRCDPEGKLLLDKEQA